MRPGYLEFFDDFDRASLGSNWAVETGSFSISANRLAKTSAWRTPRRVFAGTTTTSTADQFGKLELTDPNTDSYGFLMRFGDANGHYEVHLPPGTTEWRWEAYDPLFGFIERVDDCLGDVAISNGDVIGAKIEGSGVDTLVSVWRWDTDPNPGQGYDDLAWGAPDCVMIGDPTVPIDAGFSTGVRAHSGSTTTPALADNWSGGDVPPAGVCGNAIIESGEQCEDDLDCGGQALFDFDLTVVDGAYPGGAAPGISGAGDIDGDGLIDVVAGGGGSLQWYKAPTFQRFAIDDGVGTGPGANGLVVLDIDGDLDLDVVTGVFLEGMAWWENPGVGTAAQATWTDT